MPTPASALARHATLLLLASSLVPACDHPEPDGLPEADEARQDPADTRPALAGAAATALGQAPAPQARVAGIALAIAKDGNDVVLAWAEPVGGATVEVWASDDPFFEPGDDTATRLAEGIVGTSWVHAGGNDAVDRYYRVRTQADPAVASTTVGKIATALHPGYTKIGLCLESEVDTAAELFDDLASPVTSAHVWDAASQQWTWAWAEAPIDLPLPTGQVVSVLHEGEGPVEPAWATMVGHVPTPDDASVALLPGVNIVTLLPWRSDLGSAAEILAAVDHATRIGQWDPVAQTLAWYPDGPDFAVPPCGPVYVEVSQGSSWPPRAVRQVIGPEGGILTAYQGAVVLDVPPGALTEPVELSVTPQGYALPEVDLPAFALEPHGIELAVPIALHMRLREGTLGSDADPATAQIVRFSVDGTPTLLDTTHDPEAGTVTASLETFSYVGVVTPCPGEPSTMSITPPNPVIQAGDTLEITARLYDAGGVGLPDRPVTWTLVPPAVASFDVNDVPAVMVTGQREGSALLYASLDTCRNVHVTDDTDPSVSFDVPITLPLQGATSIDVPSCAERATPCPGDTFCASHCQDGACGTYPRNENSECGAAWTCGHEVCQGGSCQVRPQNQDASCGPTNICASYTCSGTDCQPLYYDGVPCYDDWNPCTYDACSGGVCQHYPDLWCLLVVCAFTGICW